MELPAGIDSFSKIMNFRTLEGESYLFVDKSLFIKDILNESAEVILITRPNQEIKNSYQNFIKECLSVSDFGIAFKGKELAIAHGFEELELKKP